jgi:hypothetical protein
MTSLVYWSKNNPVLIMALLVTSTWFFQKGCVPNGEASPDPAMLVDLAVQDDTVSHRQAPAVAISIVKEKRPESKKTPSQSLKHASLLLRKAADALETNQVLAVQLIRQVISILKHQVVPSLLDQNLALVPINSLSYVDEQRMDGEEPISP